MLIVIESPNKIKKIKQYSGCECLATVGHFKDLPKNDIGLALDDGSYRPAFQVMEGKSSTLAAIKAKAKNQKVFIATDPDREGYAIGYMLYQEIKQTAAAVYRAEINEITEQGVKAALAAAKPFDATNFRYYDAFLGRRCGDRLAGYILSPAASNALGELYTCGPVQSPANRLIVERERAIRNFRPEPFWNVWILLQHQGSKFRAVCQQKNLKTVTSAAAIVDQVKGLATVLAGEVATERKAQNPPPPFDTSSLTQAANATFSFSAEKTMGLAQNLFERGLITYHRTDSFRIAEEIIADIRAMITEAFGKEYLPTEPRQYKSKHSQADAHEAIRPTAIHAPDGCEARVMAEDGMTADHLALYELIYRRTVAAQMAAAVHDLTRIVFLAGELKFEAQGKTPVFDGFLRLTAKIRDDDAEEEIIPALPPIREHETVEKIGQEIKEGQTTPPPRYSEGGLIKELERRGIGRPSTFASIVAGLKHRGYVELVKNKLFPTQRGEKLHDYLAANHPWIIDYKIRADLEAGLDQVEQGNVAWTAIVKSQHEKMGFAKPTAFAVSAAADIVGRCPLCGKNVVVKKGFYGCQGYNRENPAAGCRFSIPGEWAGGRIAKNDAAELLEAGKTKKALRFISRDKRPFTAFLALMEGKISMVFPEAAPAAVGAGDAAPVGACPRCGADVAELPRTFKCSEARCDFLLWKDAFGGKITKALAKELLKSGQTAKPVKLKTRDGKPYEAVLIIKDGKLAPRFDH